MTSSYTVKEGQEHRYQAYRDKVLHVTEADELYIFGYEIYRQADGSYLQHERYADSAALFKHMEKTADGQADFAAATELTEVLVLGEMSKEFWDAYGNIPNTQAFELLKRVAR